MANIELEQLWEQALNSEEFAADVPSLEELRAGTDKVLLPESLLNEEAVITGNDLDKIGEPLEILSEVQPIEQLKISLSSAEEQRDVRVAGAVKPVEKKAMEETDNFYVRVKELNVPAKIKLALYGNKTARTLLIRDTNKLIPLFVLQNSRLTEEEVLEFARNTNLDEQIFRNISSNGAWLRHYPIKLALVSNPKVAVDIALKWVKHLQERDLRRLAKSKNISQVVVSQCRKLLEKRDSVD